MSGRGALHREINRIPGVPHFFACLRLEGGHRLFLTASREHIDPIADDEWGRVADADVSLPALHKIFRPGLGNGEHPGSPVTIRTPPLRPVRGRTLRLD